MLAVSMSPGWKQCKVKGLSGLFFHIISVLKEYWEEKWFLVFKLKNGWGRKFCSFSILWWWNTCKRRIISLVYSSSIYQTGKVWISWLASQIFLVQQRLASTFLMTMPYAWWPISYLGIWKFSSFFKLKPSIWMCHLWFSIIIEFCFIM